MVPRALETIIHFLRIFDVPANGDSEGSANAHKKHRTSSKFRNSVRISILARLQYIQLPSNKFNHVGIIHQVGQVETTMYQDLSIIQVNELSKTRVK